MTRCLRMTALAATLAAAFAASPSHAAPASRATPLTPAEIYARVSASVWRIATYDVDDLPLLQGSGVVIAPETVITNCHVLAKAHRIAVKREKQSLPAKLEMWDVQRDLCQIKVAGLVAPAVALGDTAKLLVGQSALAIGNPKGLELTMSAGLVSSLRRDDTGQIVLIQTSAAISGGSSGGGLFNDQGQLIGLTTIGSIGDAHDLNFAVPVDWIKALPQRFAKLAKPAAGAASAPASVQATAAIPAPAPAPAAPPASAPTSPPAAAPAAAPVPAPTKPPAAAPALASASSPEAAPAASPAKRPAPLTAPMQ